MKAILSLAPLFVLAGCSTQKVQTFETASLPPSAYHTLVDDAVRTIALQFPANQCTFALRGRRSERSFALSLEQALRSKGFKIAQPESHTIASYAARSPHFDQSTSFSETPDPHFYEVTYTVDLEGPHFYYFTLRLGTQWQYTRLYKIASSGTLEPFSSPVVNDNTSDHVHL